MNPEFFEALMLICFGAAWPFSIYKLVKTKRAHGKSILFLVVLLAGYVFGILSQSFGKPSAVIFLYLLNLILVGVDLSLTLKYGKSAS